VIISGTDLVAEGKLQLGPQVWRLGRNSADRDVAIIVQKDAAGAGMYATQYHSVIAHVSCAAVPAGKFLSVFGSSASCRR
jgi:hypothetical protein